MFIIYFLLIKYIVEFWFGYEDYKFGRERYKFFKASGVYVNGNFNYKKYKEVIKKYPQYSLEYLIKSK